MLAFLLAASLAFTPADATLAHKTACELVERHTPRDAGTLRGRAAAAYIYEAINCTGLDARYDSFTAETPSGTRCFTNIESEYRSSADAPWVVLVSHYDTKPGSGCPGANDGASTSGLLVALGNVLFDRRPQGLNVLLLWTDGEEAQVAYGENDGFWGSRHAAQKLKDEGRDVLCVICLDMLGDRDLKIGIPRNGSPALRKWIPRIAAKNGLGECIETREELVKDDHVAFIDAGFKAVDLIDFEYGSAPGLNDYWHTGEDTIEHISVESLGTSGRLLTCLLDALHH